ncbi:MAG: SUMF1/EgtB/PvdO family nonheme iron enzyme [Lentisphaerae bacterium]|nr:SUMF1/EgtB/PvdO family nonheme iron enzyme [Lentisphaerota bacterium]MBT4820162.1 SUMF1/EgtB/PvdO family nonheme iron enzyme [Lentisphaerota bacterium]MBT5611945.1 SUMF1/EgtB/PvdO family nonheme iron enzyme [Lentisphaerota bacterium]MBT7057901.1 SUMF1/EgtB/PvdO family nonheme iron enzyme [Lentisphaerota bacterium]MBT7843712.1 SUMF1/EgtB/PvdO family nonheme iron enzyme [Lentisphaerota bacterium]
MTTAHSKRRPAALFICLGVALITLPARCASPRQITIAAHEFDQGNVRISLAGQQYASTYPCIWNGNKYPNKAEYDVELPVTATYELSVLYTAASSRPVDVLVDGKVVHTGLQNVTGNWDTEAAAWEKQCLLKLVSGAHKIALQRAECMPHICAIRLTSSVDFPDGWRPERDRSSGIEWGTPPAQITIMAPDFDRSNLQVSKTGTSYAKRYPCIWNARKYPNQAEYEIDFPVTADYEFSALYTAQASRPVDILLDGKKVHTGFAGVTGSWDTDKAAWEKQLTLRVEKGVHTVMLQCQSCMPHICGFRLTSSEPFPVGWKLLRPGLEERRQREAIQARIAAGRAALDLINPTAIRRAIADLAASFPETVPPKENLLSQLALLKTQTAAVRERLESGDEKALADIATCQSLQRDILLTNPLLGVGELLVIKRSVRSPHLGLPQNWQSNCVLPRSGFNDEIARLSPRAPAAALKTVHKPEQTSFVGDVDLDFDGRRMLFSSIGTHNRWQIFEINTDGTGLRQVTPGRYKDVDNYDACYLPDGRLVFSSTRPFASVPCVNGSTRVANLFIMDHDGTNTRQLCFDQEHNWCPTVMQDGRILYTRWEYTDAPHTHSRLLFRMNPDGTQQMEYYGSNSYWPNAMFYTRPIPGHPTRVVTIVGGHHGVRRMGELVILDPAIGRHEADGVVQRIPGYGQKVAPLIEDRLVDDSWPKFLHPFPLGDPARPDTGGKYFLVASQPSPTSLWGIYLVDVFDNLVLLREEPGYALLEPLPLHPTPRPPVVPDKVDLTSTDCTVQITDIYRGPGLQGIPRGAVKRLRLFTYTYDYPGMGGPQGVVGMEGPWDIRRILGTVPVAADGSANFRAPANTPISVQPLDADGATLQIMRSWLTGMPGEVVSCVGCHESQNAGIPNQRGLAMQHPPKIITPWRGPPRGYSFQREVQPVLDRYCVSCHSGSGSAIDTAQTPETTGGNGGGPPLSKKTGIDLRGTVLIDDYDSRYHHGRHDAGKFSIAYTNLQRFVRRPGLESDYHLLTPMEFHVSTTQLWQMLRKGHNGVTLDAEAWDRLATWIDLNAPYHGSWLAIAGEKRVTAPAARRREMLKRYANVDIDMEWTGPERTGMTVAAVAPTSQLPDPNTPPGLPGWPLTRDEARKRQMHANEVTQRHIDLADGVSLSLMLIPGGKFVMGSAFGNVDERPVSVVEIAPFWMGSLEISNAQYARFDPSHDSKVEVRHAMQFGVRGWPLNNPDQPVVRVSWHEAMNFCKWLADKTGESFTLPTEAEWEYACRAGTAAAFHFGEETADFTPFANLADATLRDAVSHPYRKEVTPMANPTKYDDWIPRHPSLDDGQLVTAPGGGYSPNAWGLHDTHGNVWEWTLSRYRPYPYLASDGRNQNAGRGDRVARGGSWRDRPARATASVRLRYRPYQRVYNVGFRVCCPGSKRKSLQSRAVHSPGHGPG